MGFPGGSDGKESTCQCRRHKRPEFDPWVIPILAGYSVCRDPARSCKDSSARPEPPWRSAWSEATQLWGGEELLPEGPRETPRRLLRGGAKTGTCLGWSRAGSEDCATWTQAFLEPEAVPHLLGSPGLLGTWRGWALPSPSLHVQPLNEIL